MSRIVLVKVVWIGWGSYPNMDQGKKGNGRQEEITAGKNFHPTTQKISKSIRTMLEIVISHQFNSGGLPNLVSLEIRHLLELIHGRQIQVHNIERPAKR